MVESSALTPEANALLNKLAAEGHLGEQFPYFNTGTFLLYVDGLIDLFGLKALDFYLQGKPYTETQRAQIAEKVEAVTRQLPVYMDLKGQLVGSGEHEMYVIGLQEERISGDVTALKGHPAVFGVVARKGHFNPVKEEKNLADAEKMRQLAAEMNVRHRAHLAEISLGLFEEANKFLTEDLSE